MNEHRNHYPIGFCVLEFCIRLDEGSCEVIIFTLLLNCWKVFKNFGYGDTELFSKMVMLLNVESGCMYIGIHIFRS